MGLVLVVKARLGIKSGLRATGREGLTPSQNPKTQTRARVRLASFLAKP